ncbi:hypothetical protein FD754_023452 [Muntiacus muntjak]|uniref:TEX10-like TPR repeats domain-containing protein n=1 Tax=Muntiacus muntjak TaxID=9888 RepID=A0A5N3UTD5_MUNMU|nr:hypothetical protein FD754_023452 [Muntiacus muntjak]
MHSQFKRTRQFHLKLFLIKTCIHHLSFICIFYFFALHFFHLSSLGLFRSFHRYSGREPLQVQLEVGIIYQSPHSKLVRSRIKVCREFHSNINVCLTKIFKCVEVFNIKHCMILSNNVDHLLLNLTLSDIMVSLANASTLQKDSSWIERIRKFVTETLEDGSRLNSKQLNRLLGVSWRLMQMQSNRDGCQCSATESLIKAVYTLYQQRGLLLPVPTLLLKFFSKSYQKEELRSYRIQYRSKVLSRWLAGLPLQLAHLGSRNPELSTQLIDIIHTAAARANKELLKSLQVTALRIYDPQEGTVVVLSAESQQLLVQLVYFLPSLPADLLSRLSCCCIMGRLSANLAAMLIGILHMRSSFSEWKSSVKEWNGSDQLNISNEDYFSFLFSTLTGFSKEELTWLQSLRGVPHVIQTQLSPLLLYLTDLDQFSHHWDVTEHFFFFLMIHKVLVGALKSLGTSFLVTPIHVPSLVSKCILLDNFCVFTNDLLKLGQLITLQWPLSVCVFVTQLYPTLCDPWTNSVLVSQVVSAKEKFTGIVVLWLWSLSFCLPLL